MTFENKKFLDKIGISHLWEKIENQFINSEELNVVIEAIDEVKADKESIDTLNKVIDNKADAKDHNIKTYNNLDQIGLSNDDMSSTDFLTNIKAINTALGEDDSILYLTTTNADNLHLSAVDKLNADTGKELGYVMVEGNGKFVARTNSDNIIAYSEDGINWEQSILPVSIDWTSIAYGNGKFVAVANDSEIVAYSEDCINWE